MNLSKPEDRFKWFLASMLFAKRISTEIARRTYRRFEAENLTTPDKILDAGWNRLVEALDSGGYVRYDFSTASNLLEAMSKLRERYGDLEELHRQAADPTDLEKRLQEFKGVGPVSSNIFLRELRNIWEKAEPEPSTMALKIGRKLGITRVEPYEASLIRLSIEYCKRHRCKDCPVQENCKEHPDL